jgi:hypothetical protein
MKKIADDNAVRQLLSDLRDVKGYEKQIDESLVRIATDLAAVHSIAQMLVEQLEHVSQFITPEDDAKAYLDQQRHFYRAVQLCCHLLGIGDSGGRGVLEHLAPIGIKVRVFRCPVDHAVEVLRYVYREDALKVFAGMAEQTST